MKKKHIYLILCFLWMALIFVFSSQPGDDSQSLSNDVIKMIENILHIDIIKQGGWLFESVSFLVRKAAHMSEYAILAILYALCLKAYGVRRFLLLSLVFVVLYASSDEIHQLFVYGRSGQIKDVCIDTIGGSIGLLLYYGITSFLHRRNKGG